MHFKKTMKFGIKQGFAKGLMLGSMAVWGFDFIVKLKSGYETQVSWSKLVCSKYENN